ncbi:MAG: hypothetical protein NT062_23905 [Proteobacteria bacterium]|nr:hypothetical protein [Pseudomonadota bacterium]
MKRLGLSSLLLVSLIACGRDQRIAQLEGEVQRLRFDVAALHAARTAPTAPGERATRADVERVGGAVDDLARSLAANLVRMNASEDAVVDAIVKAATNRVADSLVRLMATNRGDADARKTARWWCNGVTCARLRDLCESDRERASEIDRDQAAAKPHSCQPRRLAWCRGDGHGDARSQSCMDSLEQCVSLDGTRGRECLGVE